MGVWSRLTRFIRLKFATKKQGGDIDLKPEYLPLIPKYQQEYAEEAWLSLAWARGYVPKIHDDLMTTGTGNDIVTVGAEYIAGKSPEIRVTSSTGELDSKTTKILEEALRINRFDQLNVKAVELSGAGGAAALKIDVLEGNPYIRVLGVNQFWADFKNGEPIRFNFFEKVISEKDNLSSYYLVETREVLTEGEITGGFSTFSLKSITSNEVKDIPLEKAPSDVREFVNSYDIELGKTVAIGLASVGAYLLNNTPSNTRFPFLDLGESDLAQCHDLLLSHDYTFNMYMRELEKTKTKVAASNRLFRKAKGLDGKDEFYFNPDEDYYTLFKGSLDGGSKVSDLMQFLQGEFRDSSYRETMEYLAQKVVSKAGYNPNTFNLGNRDVKATEIWSLQDATVRKIEKKKRLIQNVYEKMLWDFLELLISNESEEGTIDNNSRVVIEFPDPMTVNLNELSSTLNNMNSALAMSVEEKVKLIHPKWEDEQIKEEVKRIYLENAIGEVPDPEAIGGMETRGG
ncbi:hypothetical protein U2520_15030 [Listeria monocytogenes]|uniref:hypothetical protein n=1 Tax=Listeria monocytogenes TaxID=1639 RepID=UPI00086C1A4F|nr:hypothetical protein [Listeria monocytogenes]EAC2526799.1 hypothetical protein [Listeria monocytogenes]EAE2488422.1 hypothetical protein [Listeria monocytogenes]EAE4637584.1 hypothetical protein [Listeria monocytogenes]EAE9673864.1 hypothetical protein [Listeria monocytogenes]EDN7813427.1 hypothetical protein [Listeria monocytogenes]